MAICNDCNREMTKKHKGCTVDTVEFSDGTSMPSIKYGVEEAGMDVADPCHDCGAPLGTYHHPGCDMERCPKCKGQLISCGCLDEDEEEYDDGYAELPEEEEGDDIGNRNP